MKDKQKKRGGGSNIEKPPENDIYIHPKHAQEIVKYLSPHFPIRLHYNVLDACCGHGVLGDAIKDYYSRKINSDVSITYQDIKINGKSILDEKYDKLFDIIICNPPWVPVDLPEAIYHYLIGLLNTGGVLIFIINNTFVYQGIDRAILLDYQKYYFLPRYTFKPAGKDLLDAGVMICHSTTRQGMGWEASELKPFIPLTRIYDKLDLPGIKPKTLFEEVS